MHQWDKLGPTASYVFWMRWFEGGAERHRGSINQSQSPAVSQSHDLFFKLYCHPDPGLHPLTPVLLQLIFYLALRFSSLWSILWTTVRLVLLKAQLPECYSSLKILHWFFVYLQDKAQTPQTSIQDSLPRNAPTLPTQSYLHLLPQMRFLSCKDQFFIVLATYAYPILSALISYVSPIPLH